MRRVGEDGGYEKMMERVERVKEKNVQIHADIAFPALAITKRRADALRKTQHQPEAARAGRRYTQHAQQRSTTRARTHNRATHVTRATYSNATITATQQ